MTQCAFELCGCARPLLVAQLKPRKFQLASFCCVAEFVVLALTLSGAFSGPAVSEGSLDLGYFRGPRPHGLCRRFPSLLEPGFLVALLERPSHQLV